MPIVAVGFGVNVGAGVGDGAAWTGAAAGAAGEEMSGFINVFFDFLCAQHERAPDIACDVPIAGRFR